MTGVQIVVALACAPLATAIACRARRAWRQHRANRMMRRMGADMEAMMLEVGQRLLPFMRSLGMSLTEAAARVDQLNRVGGDVTGTYMEMRRATEEDA